MPRYTIDPPLAPRSHPAYHVHARPVSRPLPLRCATSTSSPPYHDTHAGTYRSRSRSRSPYRTPSPLSHRSPPHHHNRSYSSPTSARRRFFPSQDTPPTPAMTDFRGSDASSSIASTLKPWDLSPSQLNSFVGASGDAKLGPFMPPAYHQKPVPAAMYPHQMQRPGSSFGVAATEFVRPIDTKPRSISNSASIGHDVLVGGTGAVLVAAPDTIDPFLLALPEVQSNSATAEYVWSPNEVSLYDVNTPQGRQVVNEPGAIRMSFPPGTMITAFEKDGTVASPAHTALHSHSNEWWASPS